MSVLMHRENNTTSDGVHNDDTICLGLQKIEDK